MAHIVTTSEANLWSTRATQKEPWSILLLCIWVRAPSKGKRLFLFVMAVLFKNACFGASWLFLVQVWLVAIFSRTQKVQVKPKFPFARSERFLHMASSLRYGPWGRTVNIRARPIIHPRGMTTYCKIGQARSFKLVRSQKLGRRERGARGEGAPAPTLRKPEIPARGLKPYSLVTARWQQKL